MRDHRSAVTPGEGPKLSPMALFSHSLAADIEFKYSMRMYIADGGM